MISAVNNEIMRPGFEEYISKIRGPHELERYPETSSGRPGEYCQLIVEAMWKTWCEALRGLATIRRTGPDTPNNDMVICPHCTSQFTAIPVNVQAQLRALEAPTPSHVHCQCCGTPDCPGVRVRQALPAEGPSPEQILQARAEGRSEALEILTALNAEKFADGDGDYITSISIADTGDYDIVWNTDKLRELFKIKDYPESLVDRLESIYWTQQAYIDSLQMQIVGEWLPIEAAESEKDGRYILAWFQDRPRSAKLVEDDPPEPWVAAVRWSGSDLQLWSMLGVGGLQPTMFRRVTGPDGKPVGYIRPNPADQVCERSGDTMPGHGGETIACPGCGKSVTLRMDIHSVQIPRHLKA